LHPAIPGSAARGRVGGSNLRRMTAVGAVRRGRRRFDPASVRGKETMALAELAAGFGPTAAGADPGRRAERRPPPFFLKGDHWKGFLTVA
jgi:hypothetical protein